MKENRKIEKKDRSPDKSTIIKNEKSSIIIDGDIFNENKSDFSLSMIKNIEKPDDDLSKSSEENIDDKLSRLMKIKKEGGNIFNNIELNQKETKKQKSSEKNAKKKEEKKEESKSIDKSLSMNKTNINLDESSIENRSIYRIKAKKRKLELLKNVKKII